MSEVTHVLQAMSHGDARAAEELLPLVYDELRKLASCRMAREPPGQTLQPTALVHEAWLRLAGKGHQEWDNRAHFFGAAAEAMRRILIDNARRKQAQRHGGGQPRLDIQEIELAAPATDDQLLAIDEALDKLAAAQPEKAELVKLRYFAGLSIEEAAEVLKISAATAKRWWAYARAWLFSEIQRGGAAGPRT
jgi:RNA polymerase sigma factor (TIGR02999 family)